MSADDNAQGAEGEASTSGSGSDHRSKSNRKGAKSGEQAKTSDLRSAARPVVSSADKTATEKSDSSSGTRQPKVSVDQQIAEAKERLRRERKNGTSETDDDFDPDATQVFPPLKSSDSSAASDDAAGGSSGKDSAAAKTATSNKRVTAKPKQTVTIGDQAKKDAAAAKPASTSSSASSTAAARSKRTPGEARADVAKTDSKADQTTSKTDSAAKTSSSSKTDSASRTGSTAKPGSARQSNPRQNRTAGSGSRASAGGSTSSSRSSSASAKARSESASSGTAKSDTAKSDAAKSDTAKSDAAKSDTAKPGDATSKKGGAGAPDKSSTSDATAKNKTDRNNKTAPSDKSASANKTASDSKTGAGKSDQAKTGRDRTKTTSRGTTSDQKTAGGVGKTDDKRTGSAKKSTVDPSSKSKTVNAKADRADAESDSKVSKSSNRSDGKDGKSDSKDGKSDSKDGKSDSKDGKLKPAADKGNKGRASDGKASGSKPGSKSDDSKSGEFPSSKDSAAGDSATNDEYADEAPMAGAAAVTGALTGLVSTASKSLSKSAARARAEVTQRSEIVPTLAEREAELESLQREVEARRQDQLEQVDQDDVFDGLVNRDRRLQARKVRRVVRHIDPWSVLGFSVLFHLCVFLAFLLASVLVWNAADAAGTIDQVEDFIRDLGDFETFEIDGDSIFRSAMAIAGILTLASSVLVVLLTVVFNLISDLIGGIRLTVIEEENVRLRKRRKTDRVGEESSDQPGDDGS